MKSLEVTFKPRGDRHILLLVAALCAEPLIAPARLQSIGIFGDCENFADCCADNGFPIKENVLRSRIFETMAEGLIFAATRCLAPITGRDCDVFLRNKADRNWARNYKYYLDRLDDVEYQSRIMFRRMKEDCVISRDSELSNFKDEHIDFLDAVFGVSKLYDRCPEHERSSVTPYSRLGMTFYCGILPVELAEAARRKLEEKEEEIRKLIRQIGIDAYISYLPAKKKSAQHIRAMKKAIECSKFRHCFFELLH